MNVIIANTSNQMVDESLIKNLIYSIIKNERDDCSDINLIFCSDKEIHELNRNFRNKDCSTDVLSFSAQGGQAGPPLGRGSPFGHPKGGPLKKIHNLGEIVICPQEVKKKAKRYATNFKKELARVSIHGILSLLGYEHEKAAAEAKKMEEKEQYYLSQII